MTSWRSGSRGLIASTEYVRLCSQVQDHALLHSAYERVDEGVLDLLSGVRMSIYG